MPITFQDIKEHYEQYGLRDINDMSTAEYKQSLADGAFFGSIIMILFAVRCQRKF